MKYSFRFTDTYIADLDQIISAEILNSTRMSIVLLLKTGYETTVDFDTVEDCTQRFEDFCRACTDCALQQQLKGK